MARKSLDTSELTGKSWSDLSAELEAENFTVDHYHGMLETKNEAGGKFQDLVHINIHKGEVHMNSTLMGVGSEMPEDFVSLNADEWHE